eukprot:11872024-Alexandrium_andersonii.AAC.1
MNIVQTDARSAFTEQSFQNTTSLYTYRRGGPEFFNSRATSWLSLEKMHTAKHSVSVPGRDA